MKFAVESYDNTLYKLTTTIKNTGDNDIEMNKGVFRYNSDINHFALFNYVPGNLSYPDDQSLLISIVDDEGKYIHSVTHVFPSGSWVNSKLKKNDSFTIVAHVKAYTTSLNELANSMEFFVDGNVPPLFNDIKIYLSGNDHHETQIYYRAQGSSAAKNITISENDMVAMRIGKAYNVWSENFVEGTYRYISESTLASPSTIVSNSGASLTLSFNKERVETALYTINVSGLPNEASVPATLTSTSGEVKYDLIISNGENRVLQVLLSNYLLKIENVTDLEAEEVYTPSHAPMVSVSSNGSNSINVTFSATSIYPFSVKGYPNYLSHGTVTSASASIDSNFEDTKIDVIFKYSGNDGAGDRGKIAPTYATQNTIEQSRRLEAEMNRNVMPLMIHYTANASGGGSKEAIKDLEGDNLYFHYRSLIEEINVMLNFKDDEHPYPASLIVSPDLLGAIQQDVINGHDEGILTKHFDVNAKIKLAFEDANIDVSNLPTFENNFKGYLQSINYTITYVGACSIPFGYQQNVWSAGSALWVFNDANEASDPQTIGNKVAAFMNDLGVYKGDWKPDFVAFDRYERDCFGPDGRLFYAWTPQHWNKYLDYCKVIAAGIGNPPVMLWQIPGGHVPTDSETLVNFDPTRFSSVAPQYLLGDSSLNAGAANAVDVVKNISLNGGSHYGSSSTVSELLMKDTHDWTTNQLKRLAEMNVFNICWGGGSTLGTVPIGTNGDDDGWLANKLDEYYHDVYFNTNKDFGYAVSVACGQTLGSTTDNPYTIVYPNPTTEAINFSSSVNVQKLILYDAKGRVCHQVEGQNIVRFSLKGLRAGLYFAKIHLDNNKEVTIKIVKIN